MQNKTLIIGLGNTLLKDDGAGIHVARGVKDRVGDLDNVDIVEASIGGIGLIDLMQGYDTVYIVDALKTAESVPGKTLRCSVEVLGDPTFGSSSHFLDLRTAVELGRQCGYKMPRHIEIFAVEIADNTEFSESLTPEVEKALPSLVSEIIVEIQKGTSRGDYDSSETPGPQDREG
jgi:hydrogenase maturation protease